MSDLRQDVEGCLRSAIEAVQPRPLVRAAVAERFAEAARGPVHVVAVGKAAAEMAAGAVEGLEEGVATGLVVTTRAQSDLSLRPFQVMAGGHPLPDEGSLRAAEEVLDRLGRLTADDRLLFLLSGGASALLSKPSGRLRLEDLERTTEALLRAGADITELNTVRKHLDLVKGGRLALWTDCDSVDVMALSDVVGDRLDVIGSGPFAPDRSTFADAIGVLERLEVWRDVPGRVREWLMAGREGREPETPTDGDACFARVRSRVVGSNRIAAKAALEEAGRRGYRGLLLSTSLTGEARSVGEMLGAVAREIRESGSPVGVPACVVAGGETTVVVRGTGKGGRNQEVALGAALAVEGLAEVAIASVGTDGIDGPTDAAGGLAFGDTVARSVALHAHPRHALADNDAYPLLDSLGDLIVLGPTGTNVMDLQVVLVAPEKEKPVDSSIPPLHATQPVEPERASGAPGEPAAFAALGLGPAALAAVRAAGFTQPTAIQERGIPLALEEGDLVGLAETGSGKTAAFCLPLIDRIGDEAGPRAVILCPTREIALQTHRFLTETWSGQGVRSVALVGGLAIGPQIKDLERRPPFAVATPGRLLDHMERRTFDGRGVKELILDEADHMLDLGFLPQIQAILERLPRNRRTMMFSATMPPDIERLANRFMSEAVQVDLRPKGGAAEGIEHGVYKVARDDKKACLLSLLRDEQGSTLVFMRRKVDADWACRQLELDGHPVDRIHSDRSQRQRMEALQGFREGEHRILVATDVAARGIDIPRIEHIINFDLPETVEDYIHRAGRTARGDRKGRVSSIITWREKAMVREIEAALGSDLPHLATPGVEPYVEPAGARRRKKMLRRRLL